MLTQDQINEWYNLDQSNSTIPTFYTNSFEMLETFYMSLYLYFGVILGLTRYMSKNVK